MNSKISNTIVGLLAVALLAGSAFAEEIPETFLGVGVDAIPEALHGSLDLEPGTGLVVNFVAQDSPAGRGGLKKEDILLKFEDQILIHPAQLSTLVRNRIGGETVTLEIMRAGEAQSLDVILVEHLVDRPVADDGADAKRNADPVFEDPRQPQAPRAAGQAQRPPFGFQAFPGGGFGFGIGGAGLADIQQQMEEAQAQMEQMMGGLQFQFDLRGLDQGAFNPDGVIEELRRAMREGMRAPAPRADGGAGGGGGRFGAPNFRQMMNSSSSSAMISDGEHLLQLRTEDGKAWLNAKTAEGTEIYDGPYNTEEEKAAVPDEVREKLKSVHVRQGGPLRHAPKAPAPAPAPAPADPQPETDDPKSVPGEDRPASA